jgi:hypothetical protein
MSGERVRLYDEQIAKSITKEMVKTIIHNHFDDLVNDNIDLDNYIDNNFRRISDEVVNIGDYQGYDEDEDEE